MLKEPIKCESYRDKVLKFERLTIPPDQGKSSSVYDFYVDSEDFKWKKWSDFIERNEENFIAKN